MGSKSECPRADISQCIRLVSQYYNQDLLLRPHRWHQQSAYQVHEYLSPNNTDGRLPTPDTFLLNDSRDPPKFRLKVGLSQQKHLEWPPLIRSVCAQRNEQYLVRIVSFAGLVCADFHIANHTLTVVAIDGQPVHPAVADTIAICAGQSYDFIIVGSQYEQSADYIVKMTTDMLTGEIPSDRTRALIGNIASEGSSGKLANSSTNTSSPSSYGPYDSNSVSDGPSLLDPDWTAQEILDDTTLVALDHEPLLKNVNRRITFRTNQTYYEGIGTRIGIGMQPWTQPKVPALLSAFTTGELALNWTTYGPGVSPYVVRHNEVVEIYMENPQKFPHPMHLHVRISAH